MEKHILTSQQARRLGVPHLAWTEVYVTLRTKDEKPPSLANRKIAKDVYSGSRRIGGTLDLED